MERPRLGDLLLALVAADAAIVAAALAVAGLGPAAALVVAAAVAGLVLHHQTGRDRWLWGLVAVLVVLPVAGLIALRPTEAPVQDSLLLIDAAATRLLHGGDPYGHDYVDVAALRAFWLPEIPVNPLLAHFPYPPGLVLLAVPLRIAGLSAAWLWPAALVAAAAAARAAAGRAGLVAVGLSPLLLLDGFALFNDVFFLAAALAAWALLVRRHGLAAGALAAAALCLKQPALILLPPLAWLAWRQAALGRFVAGGAAVTIAVVGPFLVADAGAFVADTATYFYGAGVDSFPIRGPGLAGLLLAAGAIPSRWASFPSAFVQLPAVAIILVVGWWRLGSRPWLWAALLGAAVFGLGRTLAPNYVSVVGVLLTLELASALDRVPAGAAVDRAVDRAPRDAGVEGGA